MSKPRIHILALGGTIATRPDASGTMQMGLGADDLVAAVPLLGKLAEIEAETVSRVGSHSLSFDQIHALAAKIKPVLYQQPCYCYCDRSVGHKSLLDCYASEHGSECDICQKEAVLAYQQTQKGKTPAQIRAAIIRGDWKSVDMKPYMATSPSR